MQGDRGIDRRMDDKIVRNNSSYPYKQVISLRVVDCKICFSPHTSTDALYWLFITDGPGSFLIVSLNVRLLPLTVWHTGIENTHSSGNITVTYRWKGEERYGEYWETRSNDLAHPSLWNCVSITDRRYRYLNGQIEQKMYCPLTGDHI